VNGTQPSHHRSRGSSSVSLFAGGGEVRALCRKRDWAATSLGPPDQWAPSLRAAVQLCLDTRFPMAVWAGAELLFIYNESFLPALAERMHPWALGRPAREVWGDLWSRLGPEFHRVVREGRSLRREHEPIMLRRDGRCEEGRFTYAFTPIRDEDGRVVGVFNVSHETTASARADAALRASEQRYRALVTTSSDVVYRMSPDWKQLREIRGRRMDTGSEERTAWWLRDYVPPDEQPRVMAAIEEAQRTKQPFEIEHRFLFDDGSVGWTASRAIPVLDAHGEVDEWIGAATDITERKRAEERLREADRRKDEFMAMLGHELRNPLAAIRSAADLVNLAAPEDEILRQAGEVLERQSTHMARLIDGLLEVSRIARGKLHLEPETVDVRRVVEGVLQDRTTEVDKRGLTLHAALPSEPLWVWGDPVRLAQVVDNLVGNAIKFTDTPGSIHVEAATVEAHVVVRVRDTGVGMRQEMLERLFIPFQQEKQELVRSAGGLGLGLALAKELVSLHQGDIRAHSDGPGEGTEMEVRLPLASAPPAAVSVSDRPTPARHRVLVVEDHADAARMLRALLQIQGHTVTVADSGPAALEALRAQVADVVLCDLGLPGMSGLEVARAVRADVALRRTPLVALTGYGQPTDRERTAAAGFDDHLTKPVDAEHLATVIGRVTDGAKRAEEQ
jgi:signal transduction histidine kinase/CheY-like chemotaxis protein